MSFIELFIIAAALSMDAFAVSICKGLSMQKLSVKNAAIVGCYFGGFQALMPAIGFMLGYQFREVISALDHWFRAISSARLSPPWITGSPSCSSPSSASA